MQRREFITHSNAAFLTALLSQFPVGKDATSVGGSIGRLQLGRKEDPEQVAAVYLCNAKGLSASEVPYVYAFYDEHARRFVSPLELATVEKAGLYTLEPVLHAFNLRRSDQAKFRNLRNQVQLGLNATAPVTNSDQLTWLFMSVINVFLGKASNRTDQLTKLAADKNGIPLQANPKINITKGIVNLQITAFGQRQDGLWKKFFDTTTALVKSPVVSVALKGFGVPSLAGDALTFVDQVIGIMAAQEKLVPLWNTGSLEFAIHEGANARFKMNQGLWAVIDSGYAQETGFLEGHSIDLEFQSYRIKDKNGNPADANYLVADIKLTK